MTGREGFEQGESGILYVNTNTPYTLDQQFIEP